MADCFSGNLSVILAPESNALSQLRKSMKGMASLAEEDWFAENFKLAQEDVYSPEIRNRFKSNLTDREPIVCTEAYLKHSSAIVQQRILVAGLRL